jgi:Ca2+-binding RTX toxin-like protein
MANVTESGIPVSDVPLTTNHDNGIDGLIAGMKWGDSPGTPVTLTYSFSNPNSLYDLDGKGTVGTVPQLTSLTDEQKESAREALNAWSEVANLKFVEVEDTGNSVGDIRFDRRPNVGTATGGFPSQAGGGGDIKFDDKKYNDSRKIGSYDYETFLHEIGHTLGLKHPHDGSNDGTVGQVIFDPAKDSTALTVMSYRSYIGADVKGGLSGDFYPTTPMLKDIDAIQYLYGKNMTTRAGNDTYNWNNLSKGGDKILETIWDAGGNDTIDWSDQSSAAKINLNAGQWSNLGPAYNNGKDTVSETVAIADGVTIENAIGGAGNDAIIGNEVNNSLQGNSGNDALTGGAGADTFVFKSATEGADTIEDFNQQEGDKIRFDAPAKADQFKYNAQTGELSFDNQVFVTLANKPADFSIDNDLILQGIDPKPTPKPTPDPKPTPTPDPKPTPTPNPTSLIGTDGDDVLVSRNDKGDSVFGLAGNDKLTGGLGNDTLDGGAGNDTLDGGAGNDSMSGGLGDDSYTVDASSDVVTEAINQGHDTVLSSVDYSLSDNVEDLTLTGTTAGNGTGNNLDNLLIGNAANNNLYGGDGLDQLNGEAGDDYLYGQGGNDLLNGGDGTDWLVGDLGDDIISGGAGNDRLIGGLGNDTLIGEQGRDRLTGGADADRFVLNTLDKNFDIITDFQAAQGDKIMVSTRGMSSNLKQGRLAAVHFTLGSTSEHGKSDFIYDRSSGRLFFDVDGIGGHKQVQIAKLASGTALTSSNILITA